MVGPEFLGLVPDGGRGAGGVSVLASTAAIAVTLAGIGRLAATDPKRRRSFGMQPFRGNRQVVLALTAVFMPGVLLLAIGSGADFIAWLGAICVAGWAVAAVSPWRVASAWRWMAAVAAAPHRLLVSAVAGVRRLAAAVLPRSARAGIPGRDPVGAADDGTVARIAELERRVAQLEAALAAPSVASYAFGTEGERRVTRLPAFQRSDLQDAKVLRTGDR